MSREKKQRGLVLVTVLWVVVLLMIMAATVGRTSRLHTKMAHYQAQSLRCQWGARAGVETAIAILKEDVTSTDSLSDLWSDNDEDFTDISLSACHFTVRVLDESGKLDINGATKQQLMALPDMEEPIADAILDWRDENSRPSDQGVETGYYRNLTFPYECRNGPFRTIRELLLVKGVTEDLLYGEDTNFNGVLDLNERDGDESLPMDNGDSELDQGWIAFLSCYGEKKNTNSAGQPRININSADQGELERSLSLTSGQAQWIVDNRNSGFESSADILGSDKQSQGGDPDDPTPLDQDTFRNIVDSITIFDDNNAPVRVNVNTAPKEVLMALLESPQGNDELALSIIDYREGFVGGIANVADLLQVESLSRNQFKKIVDRVTVRSDLFCIYSVATADRTGISGATEVVEAVVDRSANPIAIRYWYQGVRF